MQRNTEAPKETPGSWRRYGGPLLGFAFVVLSSLAALTALIAMATSGAAPPLWFFVLYLLISAVIIGGAAVVSVQRIRELRRGEENEARKY